MMAMTSPGCATKLRPLMMGSWLPGAPATTASTLSTPLGGGSGMAGTGSGMRDSSLSRRCMASRAFTTRRHCVTSCASGVSTRPPSTEATMAMPPLPLSVPVSCIQHDAPRISEPSTSWIWRDAVALMPA